MKIRMLKTVQSGSSCYLKDCCYELGQAVIGMMPQGSWVAVDAMGKTSGQQTAASSQQVAGGKKNGKEKTGKNAKPKTAGKRTGKKGDKQQPE